MDDFKIKYYSQIDDKLYKKLFEFEKELFSTKYNSCPTTFVEFCKKRTQSNIIAFTTFNEKKIVGTIVYEKVTQDHIYCSIIGVLKPYRNHGVFINLLIQSINQLKSEDYKYLSLWCEEDSFLPKLFDRYINRISKNKNLTEIEMQLIDQFYSIRPNRKNIHSTSRVSIGFYTTIQKTKSNAIFVAYNLK